MYSPNTSLSRTAAGFDAERILEERRQLAAQEIDLNSAAHNSTVREYEQVNESNDGGGEGNAAGEEMVDASPVKKSRKQ